MGDARGRVNRWNPRPVLGRLRRGLRVLPRAPRPRAGLPRPRIFEYPHYAGSAADSRGLARLLGVAFQRDLFFPGTLSRHEEDPRRPFGVVYPYVVDDIHGFCVVPENLGRYAPGPAGVDGQPVEGIVARARALRVVKDGVAGFFFHPTFDPSILGQIVDGIRGEGYTFVSPEPLAEETCARASR